MSRLTKKERKESAKIVLCPFLPRAIKFNSEKQDLLKTVTFARYAPVLLVSVWLSSEMTQNGDYFVVSRFLGNLKRCCSATQKSGFGHFWVESQVWNWPILVEVKFLKPRQKLDGEFQKFLNRSAVCFSAVWEGTDSYFVSHPQKNT